MIKIMKKRNLQINTFVSDWQGKSDYDLLFPVFSPFSNLNSFNMLFFFLVSNVWSLDKQL